MPGVGEVHDLHIWTLTSGMEVATVHIVADDDATWHRVLDSTRQILTENCAVTHPTIQLEPADHVERTADSDRGVCNGFGPPGPRCCTQVCGRARGQGVHTSARRLQKGPPDGNEVGDSSGETQAEVAAWCPFETSQPRLGGRSTRLCGDGRLRLASTPARSPSQVLSAQIAQKVVGQKSNKFEKSSV